MTEQPQGGDNPVGDEDDTRKQLWIRAGVAGGLIGLLLGGLAIYDHVSMPPEPPPVALPAKPIAPAQITPEAGRDAPPDVVRAGAETASPPSPPAEEAAAPSQPSGARRDKGEVFEPAHKALEGATPGQRVAAAPAVTTPPARSGEVAAKTAAETPAVASSAAPTAVTASPPPASNGSAGSIAAKAAPAVVASSPAGAAPAAAPTAAPAAKAPTPSFGVEVGAFVTLAQADALRARLMAEGIPAQLETRVVVGPFGTRNEAVAAQDRLRGKGFSAGEVVPFRR